MTQGHGATGGFHHILNHEPHLVQITAKLFKHSDGTARRFAENPEKKMFRPHIAVAKLDSLLLGVLHDRLNTFGKVFFHTTKISLSKFTFLSKPNQITFMVLE